jgi:hypothetical protein
MEGVAVAIDRPPVRPVQMGAAEPAKPSTAQVALHLTGVQVPRQLAESAEVGGAVRQVLRGKLRVGHRLDQSSATATAL